MGAVVVTVASILLVLFLQTVSAMPAENTVKLVNGYPYNLACSGRVEIYHDGTYGSWGTVCHDGWGMKEAQVVCRQLGCGPAVAAKTYAYFGKGMGRIWLDDVSCLGNETSISQCDHPGFGVHNCGHAQDAGVVCEAESLEDEAN